jgi:MATE family multidrug resistance protein
LPFNRLIDVSERNLPPRLLPSLADSRALLALALPVVGVQVGLMLMGVVDTIMVGRLSAVALAGVALGNLYFFACSIFGMGALFALDPVVAQAVGAGDREGIARGVQRGHVLALLLAVPSTLLLLFAEPALAALGQPAEVVPLAGAYARWCAPGVLPFYLFVVQRQSLQALRHMQPILLTIAFANVLNVLLDWMFIYGRLGAPAMGVAGAAIATSIGRWALPLVLLLLSWRDLEPAIVPPRREALEAAPLWRTLRIGAPIGLQMMLEYAAFGAVALLMGRIGTTAVAAHQVAINLASLTFMVPLGVGQAGAVLVGHAIGARDQASALGASRAAVAFGVGFMAFTAVAFLLLPGPLARLYTSDAATVELAAALLPVAGVFQLFDGTQAVTSGLLRGAGDTRIPMLTNLGGYWLFGLPLSLLLGFRTSLGAVGLWWGLAAALGLVATVLALRTWRLLHAPLARVTVEGPTSAPRTSWPSPAPPA